MAIEDDLSLGGMSKPPVNPPRLPTLSALPSRPLGGEEAGGPQKGSALLRLFYEVEKTLDTIASAAPGQSETLDQIKTRLRDVMTAVVNGGADQGKPNSLPLAGDVSNPLR